MKFILIVIGVYFVIKYLFRAFFPVIVKKTFDKMQQQQQNQQQYQEKPEGEVTVEKKTTNKENHNTKGVGDYVDFEEVDE
jgi:ABC-type bacteriocin/lantibiotic exporter with double-glycine peptidase domain